MEILCTQLGGSINQMPLSFFLSFFRSFTNLTERWYLSKSWLTDAISSGIEPRTTASRSKLLYRQATVVLASGLILACNVHSAQFSPVSIGHDCRMRLTECHYGTGLCDHKIQRFCFIKKSHLPPNEERNASKDPKNLHGVDRPARPMLKWARKGNCNTQ